MLQWGTSDALKEYQQWSVYFRDIIEPTPEPSALTSSLMLFPLAGRGSRFAKENYSEPKTLIPVSGTPMIVQAASDLPLSQKTICLFA